MTGVTCGAGTADKRLKIPKGQSEAVNCRTDTIIVQNEKGQTVIYKILPRKLTIEQQEPYKEQGIKSCASEG